MQIAAIVFTALVGVVVLFQLALAAGAPWGEYAMGGRHPGRFPPGLRVGAVVQAAALATLAVLVLSHAALLVPELALAHGWTIWLVVGVSGLTAVLNVITPSRKERRLWAPVGVGLFATSLVVALA